MKPEDTGDGATNRAVLQMVNEELKVKNMSLFSSSIVCIWAVWEGIILGPPGIARHVTVQNSGRKR